MSVWRKKRFFVQPGAPANSNYDLTGNLLSGYVISVGYNVVTSGPTRLTFAAASLAQRRAAHSEFRRLSGFTPAAVIDRTTGETVYRGLLETCQLKARSLNREADKPWEELARRLVAELHQSRPGAGWQVAAGLKGRYDVVDGFGMIVVDGLTAEAAQTLVGLSNERLGLSE